MAFQEKEPSEYDLEKFIELFDEALTSNDPRIKKALSHLLTITTLITSSTNLVENKIKPLRKLFDDYYDLQRRITKIERNFDNLPNLGKHNTNIYLDNIKKYPAYISSVKSNTSGEDC